MNGIDDYRNEQKQQNSRETFFPKQIFTYEKLIITVRSMMKVCERQSIGDKNINLASIHKLDPSQSMDVDLTFWDIFTSLNFIHEHEVLAPLENESSQKTVESVFQDILRRRVRYHRYSDRVYW